MVVALIKDFFKASFIMMKLDSYFETDSYYMKCFNIIMEENKSSKERYFLINQIIDHHLWGNDEAIRIGFHQWKTKEINNISEALEFHKDNCETHCKICQLEKEWSELCEGKRPELC